MELTTVLNWIVPTLIGALITFISSLALQMKSLIKELIHLT